MGSLSKHIVAWEELQASQWAIGVVRSGFRLPWKGSKAPLSQFPVNFPPPRDPQAVQVLDLEVQDLLTKGAIQPVQNPFSPGFYGRLFVVPKASGGWRPVLDLSILNLYLKVCRFRMETASSIRDSIRPFDWAVSIDLKDAYFHILIHKSDRKFLRFAWQGKIYLFVALPFGLAPAPWLFTRITRELCRAVRGQGIRLKVYLDDWLLLATSAAICSSQLKVVLNYCHKLGFILNQEKSDLVPSQEFLYLGMAFNTRDWVVSPSPQRLERFQELLEYLLSVQDAPARLMASLLGTMESLALLLPLGRLHKRQVQRLFLENSGVVQDWSRTFSLGVQFRLAVSKWLDLSWLNKGVPIALPPPQEFLYTDASHGGWGAHMGDLTAAGQWDKVWSESHINALEMQAVARALAHFKGSVQDKHVRLNTDNTTVACYINKQGGSHSPSLSQQAEGILIWCQNHNVTLTARYVPGKLNVLADSLSRSHMILPSEWTLSHNVLKPIWEIWFKPQIDLFATRFSKRLPLFVSPVPDPQAWAVDAFSIPWNNLVAYAFPPFPIIGKVLRLSLIHI